MKRSCIAAGAAVLCVVSAPSVLNIASAAVTPIPAPQDVAYPGTLTLDVDLTDLERRVFKVRQQIPVQAGPVTLLYPQWLPGAHSPRGAVETLAGLVIRAGGKPIAWTRDPLNVYAFHIEVPQGSRQLDVEFEFASPQLRDQGRIVVTHEMLNLQWNAVLLYPAGYHARRIRVAPAITLPQGWEFGGSVDIESRQGTSVRLKPMTLEMLVDSPLFAGRHFKRIPLSEGEAPTFLNLFADSPDNLRIEPDQITLHRNLVQQAHLLFGSRHFERYEFLLGLTDNLSGIGLEHHRSSENTRAPDFFTDWKKNLAGRDLLPHELAHSWNGKFRRPADLATPNYNVPMQNSLLWVYEGMTNYWGYMLSARSGLWDAETTRGAWAVIAASQDRNRAGRAWRNLQDTTNQPIITPRRPLSWVSWQRTEDYYTEGQLVWLDIDTRLRELTNNQRSLDDFCRAFFGVEDGRVDPLSYTFEDVVNILNSVAASDWAQFLRTRLDATGVDAPLDGITRGGWKLVFREEPGDYFKSREETQKVADLTYSLGFLISTKDAGQLTEVIWGSPAHAAGLTLGTTLIAVNGREYKLDRLKEAITAAKGGKKPIELLVKNLDRYRTVKLAYHGGLKYPTLERVADKPDLLSEIFKPRS